MGIIDRLSARAALTRLRAQVDRLRRSVISRRPAIRWGLALAAILGLAGAGYWAATSMVPVGARYLASGRRFSSEDLNKICRVLDAQRIEYRCDDQHRIAVDADQLDQAAALVAKLDVGPRPIDEARDQVNSWSVWFEGPREREQKEKLAREKMVESMIRKLDGVVWALVWINHPRASVWHRAAAKPTAFVYIETEGDRQLPFKVIQSIPEFLVGCEPDLTIGSITVMDHRGHRYLDPGNPSLGDISRQRAREEELSEQILEKLDYIKGVRVHVRVITPVASEPAAPRVADKLTRSQTEGFQPTTGLNQPLQLEPEPPPTVAVPIAVANPAASQHERGRVLINVPRSFYFQAMIDKNEDREPSEDELHKLALRTEKLIKTSVALVVSESGSWEVAIETFPDAGPLARPAVLTSAADQRRKILDWGILGAVGVFVCVLIVVTTRIQVARRPARLPEPIHKTRRYHADSASDPGPSERVRELIRRNPEAAASVLQRWTGQGESRHVTMTRQDLYPARPHGPASSPDPEARGGIADSTTSSTPAGNWPQDRTITAAAISSVRKAAIVLVSLDQSLASQLLSHLDRSAVEAVTWEIARLERIDPDERAAVLEEFYGLGLRRLCFVFDDIVKMSDGDIRAACHDEDLETWALALAGAAATVRNKVLAALAAAPASRLRHDLDHLGPFRLSDSEAAQLEIAERLRRLYDHGRIVLPDPNGREQVLV